MRKQAHLTRKELSAKIGIRRNDTLEKIEMQISMPRAWTVFRLAQAFDMDFVDFIRGTDFEEGISDLQVLRNQKVYVFRNKDNKEIALFQPEEIKPYTGGKCKLFPCAAGKPHRHCCADCEEPCPEACQNNPSRCGCYQK